MENFIHKEWGPEEWLHEQSQSYCWLKKLDLYLPASCYLQVQIIHDELFPFQFFHSLVSIHLGLRRGDSGQMKL